MATALLQMVSEHLYGSSSYGYGPTIQEINDGPDGYDKVIKALEFAKKLWEGQCPQDYHVSMPVKDLPQFKSKFQ
jgi:hypothetical protein